MVVINKKKKHFLKKKLDKRFKRIIKLKRRINSYPVENIRVSCIAPAKKSGLLFPQMSINEFVETFLRLLFKHGLKLKSVKILNTCVSYFMVKNKMTSHRFFCWWLKVCRKVIMPYRLQSKRVGREVYQIPMVVPFVRAEKRAMRLIITEARKVCKKNRVSMWRGLYFVGLEIMENKSPLLKQLSLFADTVAENRVYMKYIKKKKIRKKKKINTFLL